MKIPQWLADLAFYIVLVVILIIMSLIVFSLPAAAQQSASCARRDVFTERLAESYGEAPQALGLGGAAL